TRTPTHMTLAAPDRGQHTDEILADLGLDAEQRQALRADGVI
ncbi:MAG: CoA transferase, partial [Actinomycetia bacterium]|nr:CoA transferase [Actinomycetes bacterium]